jgi:hypothetical protein
VFLPIVIVHFHCGFFGLAEPGVARETEAIAKTDTDKMHFNFQDALSFAAPSPSGTTVLRNTACQKLQSARPDDLFVFTPTRLTDANGLA